MPANAPMTAPASEAADTSPLRDSRGIAAPSGLDATVWETGAVTD